MLESTSGTRSGWVGGSDAGQVVRPGFDARQGCGALGIEASTLGELVSR